jgi:hypothetical protein
MYQSEAHLPCKFSDGVPATRGMEQVPQNASSDLKGLPHTRQHEGRSSAFVSA